MASADDRVLSLSFRPKTFADLVGVRRVTDQMSAHVKSGRLPAAWMFVGDTGCGKTTLARILALSLQCSHGEFGAPCQDCQKRASSFDIVEINASEVTGKDDVGSLIQSANYSPRPPGKYRVFIFDEAQKLSGNSQNLMLKYFEDSPRSTMWVICTTEPGKILRTLRRRCITFTIPALTYKGVERLVAACFSRVGRTKTPAGGPADLAEALSARGVTSPGFVVVAVEKFLAGATAQEAAAVGIEATVDTLDICRFVTRGDWERTRRVVEYATAEDARAIRAALAGYLRTILVNCTDREQKAKKVARVITWLSQGTYVDGVEPAATISVLFDACKEFRG